MTDLVLLDFDGVINALSAKPMKSDHTRWEKTRLLGFPILYSPDVVDAVNAIAAKPDVTVRWLTTWMDATTEFTLLGLNQFDYLSPPPSFDGDMRIGSAWKPDVGLAAAAEWPGTVIWIDDDRDIARCAARASRKNITFIQPQGSLGLSRQQLHALDELTNK